jgi:hypothetical protein
LSWCRRQRCLQKRVASQLFLCASRACLGKKIVLSIQMRFRTIGVGVVRSPPWQWWRAAVVQRATLQQAVACNRAKLHAGIQQCPATTDDTHRDNIAPSPHTEAFRVAHRVSASPRPWCKLAPAHCGGVELPVVDLRKKTVAFFECFPYVCPEDVLVK